jgi:hypothetical protein
MRSVPTQVGVLPGALLLPTAALADPMDWEKLADDPESFIGKPVEVLSYCAEGGVKDDLDSYQCATEGDLYISTPEIKPDFAIRKIEENCGGPDVVKRSEFCRAKITFVPQSVWNGASVGPSSRSPQARFAPRTNGRRAARRTG